MTFEYGALQVRYVQQDVTGKAMTTANALPVTHPARDKIAAVPGGAAFVCVGERCSLPVTKPDEIATAVAGMKA